MKMEFVDITSDEQRILMLFDAHGSTFQSEQGQVDSYLESQGLSPKRQYFENRGDTEYLVYYFGSCYLDGHLDKLTSMTESS